MTGKHAADESTDPRLGVIALAWVFTAILHLLTFTWLAPPHWEGWAYLGATIWLSLRLSDLKRLIVFLFITAVLFF